MQNKKNKKAVVKSTKTNKENFIVKNKISLSMDLIKQYSKQQIAVAMVIMSYLMDKLTISDSATPSANLLVSFYNATAQYTNGKKDATKDAKKGHCGYLSQPVKFLAGATQADRYNVWVVKTIAKLAVNTDIFVAVMPFIAKIDKSTIATLKDTIRKDKKLDALLLIALST